MRLIKMFGLAALAAVAATAFVGASSASATSTQLCDVHTGLTCPAGEGTESVHLANEGVGKLLSNLGTVLCLNVLATATPLELGSPQKVHAETSYTNCGRNSTHTNCTVTVEEQPEFSLLKEGLDHGLLTGLSGLTHLECSGFPSLNCVYDTTGIEFEVGNNELVAEETPVNFVEGSFFCPENSTLDGVLTTLEDTYIVQPLLGTQLCDVHTGLTCPAGEGTESVHLANEGVGKLLSSFGTVLCLNVLATATLGALGNPQEVEANTSYTNCGRNSAHTNCTVTVEEQPTFDLLKDGLDHGVLTGQNGPTRVECSGFPSFYCVYDTTGIEFEVGNNELVANETPVNFVEGSFFCPENSTLDGVLTTLEDTYILQ